MISENKSYSAVRRYLLYAIGEIILVVIGILIALQINNWNTERIKKEDAIKVYQNIRQQIEDDQKELTSTKDINGFFSGQYEYASQIIGAADRSQMDTLARITMWLSQYSDFHRSGNIYETLVNSGELGLLKNTEIISKLQQLEMTYTHLNKLEDIHWEVIINELSPEIRGVINYANLKVVQPQKLFSVEIQNIFIESIFLTKGKDAVYRKALDEINATIELIEAELNSQES